jgi:glutamate/tyrosine decarboxylase-like PLP-dependent enzyme
MGWDSRLSTLLVDAERRVTKGMAVPPFDAAAFKAELDGFDFQQPMALDHLLGWTVARLESGLVHVNHPRYLGLFNPAPSFPAQCADRIAAMFNPQLASATTSPAAVAIEAHTCRAVALRAGLDDDAVGHFTSGGSEANFTALVCALTQANPAFADMGSRAFSGQPVFYISRDSHLAWLKIAHQAGIGRAAARLVPTDGIGRMDITALRALLRTDREAGCIPVMLAATAGTTNAGMIDPLEACATIAQEYGLWFHVDAAWGGALIASPRLKALLSGMESADSVTIDAHKWWATTMGCGIFLTAHAAALSSAFNVRADFMPSQAAASDPYMTTVQWSRRFAGLRLFMSLATGGWAAHAAHVERSVELARLLAQGLEKRGWTIANWPALAVTCAVPPAGSASVRDIVNRVVTSGQAWISVAWFEGQDVVRACVTNGRTSPEDIAMVLEALEAARH